MVDSAEKRRKEIIHIAVPGLIIRIDLTLDLPHATENSIGDPHPSRVLTVHIHVPGDS